ncbi:hypothetical protein HYT02_00450 [Candidatus Gottesmanbacteria bacterium]|nr:hypothetical protein [Candidatus Gottesmanbacteria bacterium]
MPEGVDSVQPIPPLQKSPEVSPLRQQKEQMWLQMKTELSQVTDGLGEGIDKGIMETVIAFNAFGIETRQSCEGHPDWGTMAPWIDTQMTTPEAEELDNKAAEAWKKADNAEKEHVSEEKLEEVYARAHEARKASEREHLKDTKRVMDLLAEFYKDRQVPFDVRLIMTTYGNGNAHLQNQGADIQQLLDIEPRKTKLAEFQKEMVDFTEFIKGKFYQDGTPVEPGSDRLKSIMEQNARLSKQRTQQQNPSNPTTSST